MNTGMENLFGIVALAGAVYAFYTAYILKMKKDITKSILLPKTVDPRKCTDKNAYIEETVPYIILVGVIALIYGIVELVNLYVMPIGGVLLAVMALALAALAFVSVKVKNINEKYF